MKVSESTNLSRACRVFGWAGGTIHQVASELGMSGRGGELALMPAGEFEALLRAFCKSQGWR
jgi:hypothetical protein